MINCRAQKFNLVQGTMRKDTELLLLEERSLHEIRLIPGRTCHSTTRMSQASTKARLFAAREDTVRMSVNGNRAKDEKREDAFARPSQVSRSPREEINVRRLTLRLSYGDDGKDRRLHLGHQLVRCMECGSPISVITEERKGLEERS